MFFASIFTQAYAQGQINDSAKVVVLNTYVDQFAFSNIDSAIFYCNLFLDTALSNNLKSLEANALYQLGSLHDLKGSYEKAYDFYFKALNKFKTNKDKRGVANCFNCIGIVLWEQSQMASDSVKKIKLDKAMEYQKEALGINKAINYQNGMAVNLMNLGIVNDDYTYLEHSELNKERRKQKAIAYYNDALKIFSEMDDFRSMADCYHNIGSLYFLSYTNNESKALNESEYEKCISYFKRALKLFENNRDLYGIAMAYEGLANVELELLAANSKNALNINKAIAYAKLALSYADSVGSQYLKFDAYLTLYKANKLLNNNAVALSYHEKYVSLKDSVYKADQLHAIEEMETRYAVQQKEQKIQLQNERINNARLKNKIQKYIIFSVIVVLLVFIVLVFKLIKLNAKNKEINNLLKYKNKQLSKLNKTQNTLLGIISHDLKAPLSAFYSITTSLKSKYSKLNQNEIEAFITRMQNSALSLKIQLENLLNWSVNQSSAIKVEKSNIVLHILVSKVVIVLHEFANEKNIDLVNNVPEQLELKTDNKLLSIVLNNLVANAIKFSLEGKKVLINAQLDSDSVLIEVVDEGIGMAKEQVAKLFNGGLNSGNENSGTGLGLIVSKDLTEKMGGVIWAESEPGLGSRFYLKFRNE